MSVPRVAVPEAGARVTRVGVVLALLRVTVKSRLPPSATVGLVMVLTCGRSSVGVTPGGTEPVPSSWISVLAVPVAMLALVGPDRLTL